MAATNLRIIVASTSPAPRLDVWLARRLAVSRQRVRRMLESGAVRIDGRRAVAADKGIALRRGTIVEVTGEALDEWIVPQADLPLEVLARGDGWIAVNKPAGVPVHPLVTGERGTVLNAVAARWPQVQGIGEAGLRSGVVHRLDVETSGVLAVAVTQPAWDRLRAAFTDRRVEKLYRALVVGAPPAEGEAVMDLRIARHRPALVRAAMVADPAASVPRGARRCDLRWRVRERFAGAALIEVDLGTGFLHQIRAMMSAMGHPIVGDNPYARTDRPAPVDAPRPMLHAWRLRIDGVDAAAEDPSDMTRMIDALRRKT